MPPRRAPMAMCQPGCCLYSAAAWCALAGEQQQALGQPCLQSCSPDVRLNSRLGVQWSHLRSGISGMYHAMSVPGTAQSCSMRAFHAPPQMLGSDSTPEAHAQLLQGAANEGIHPSWEYACVATPLLRPACPVLLLDRVPPAPASTLLQWQCFETGFDLLAVLQVDTCFAVRFDK